MTIAGGPIISGKPRDGIETTKMESGSKKVEIIFGNYSKILKFSSESVYFVKFYLAEC